MTKDEIIEMVRCSGLGMLLEVGGMDKCLEHFSKLVAEKAIKEALAQPDQGEPVALTIYRGELCYKSQSDDQSFGMWCPVTQDLPFPEGTKFYTTPSQRKPLTNEQLAKLGIPPFGMAYEQARAIESAHGIKETEK